MPRVALWLGLVLAAASCSRQPDHAGLIADLDAALDRGADYLLKQQGDDGLWHSQTYGVFREGEALTPHVLTTLMVLKPNDPRTRRGVDAVAAWVGLDGGVSIDLSNPVYGGSEASWVMLMAYRREQMAFVGLVQSYQFNEAHGWTAADAQFGGWTDAPMLPTRPVSDAAAAGRDANVSATLFAVGALRLGGVGPGDPAIQRARDFVLRCRNNDGGFFFSPSDPARNKAGPTGADADGARFHSYGSATADAVRVLLAAGVPRDNPAVVRGRAWLVEHFDANQHPGSFNPDREVLRDSYYFYWCWTAAHAFDRLGEPPDTWAPALARALLDRQREDASFANRFTDGKEDDPLVATPLALAAMRICRDRLAGE